MRAATALVALAACLLLAQHHPASAQDRAAGCDLADAAARVEASPSTAVRELNRLYDQDCLGRRMCATSLCMLTDTWIMDWRAAGGATNDALRARAIDLLDRVRGEVDEQDNDIPGATDVRQRLAGWNVSRTQALVDQIEQLRQGVAAEWQFGPSLVLFEGAADEVDTKAIVENACGDATGATQCRRVFLTEAELLTLAELQFRILSALESADRAALVRYVTDLEERWRRYHLSARANLPWELGLNGLLLSEQAKDSGFIEPPERQIILLHPVPMLAARGPSTDDMTGGLGLELIGLYAWRWQGIDMRGPWRGAPDFLQDYPLGGSLLLGFDGDNDPGLGAVIHLPRNWSLGAMVDHEGEITALLTVDVAKFFTDAGSQRKALIDAFRGQ